MIPPGGKSILSSMTAQRKAPMKQQISYVPDPVYSRLAETDKDIANQYIKLQSHVDSLINATKKRSEIRMQQAFEKQVSGKEVVAGKIAEAIALALGARGEYASGLSGNYLAGRQANVDLQNQQSQFQAEQQYQSQIGAADTEIVGLDAQRRLAETQLRGLEGNRELIYRDIANKEDNARMLEQTQLTQDRMRETSANKLEFDKYKLEFGAELQKFLNANPRELMIAKGLYDEAIEKGFSPEEARSMAFADSIKKVEEAGLIKAKTGTETTLLPLKVEEKKAEIKRIYTNIKVDESRIRLNDAGVVLKNAQAAKAAQDKVLEDSEQVTPEDIKSMTKMDNELKDKIAAVESRMKKLTTDAIGLDPVKSAEAISELATLKEQLPALQAEKELNLEALKRGKEKVNLKKKLTSRGGSSSTLHAQKLSELKQAFPGIKVGHWSEMRQKRGAGGSGVSRHSHGRALDAYYSAKVPKEKLAEWAQKNGATLIIDYAGKRNWRPGKGWYSAPKNDPSYKHLHIEFD